MSSAIETTNGNFVDPLAMRPDDVQIYDIAHSLSHQCRFNGYTNRHYSVAEHSVNVAWLVERRALAEGMDPESVRLVALQALLHDATEAYLCDIPRPVKRHLTNYKEIEARLWSVVCEKYGAEEKIHPFVHEADMRICTAEKLTLIGPDGTDHPAWGGAFTDYPPYVGCENPVTVRGNQPVHYKYQFLDMFARLKRD